MDKRILVVDDDEIIRFILQELLEEEAYKVDVASDGLIAWEKLTLAHGNYEAIVLDLHMPRMGGLQFIRMLRDWRKALLGSVLVMSADNDDIYKAMSLGIRHALIKPFDLEAVLAQVALCPLAQYGLEKSEHLLTSA